MPKSVTNLPSWLEMESWRFYLPYPILSADATAKKYSLHLILIVIHDHCFTGNLDLDRRMFLLCGLLKQGFVNGAFLLTSEKQSVFCERAWKNTRRPKPIDIRQESCWGAEHSTTTAHALRQDNTRVIATEQHAVMKHKLFPRQSTLSTETED